MAHRGEERSALAVGLVHARQIVLRPSLRGGEALDQLVERHRQRPHFVHRPHRHDLARRLGPHLDHPLDTLIDEGHVLVRVAPDRIRDRGGHPDEQRRQREQGTEEHRSALGPRRRPHGEGSRR